MTIEIPAVVLLILKIVGCVVLGLLAIIGGFFVVLFWGWKGPFGGL